MYDKEKLLKAMKILKELDTSISIVDWHIASVKILSLIPLTEKDLEKIPNINVVDGLIEGSEFAAINVLFSFVSCGFNGIGGAKYILDYISIHNAIDCWITKNETNN